MLRNIIDKLNKELGTESSDKNRIKFCIKILNLMQKNNFWEMKCKYTYKYFKDDFEQLVKSYQSEKFYQLYLHCARFLKERIIYEKRKRNHKILFLDELNFLLNDDLSSLDDYYKKEIEYIRGEKFDVDILLFYLGDISFEAFLNYEETEKKINKEIAELNDRIEKTKLDLESFFNEAEEKVKIHSEELKRQETGFNFVGLDKGFKNILEKKEKSRDSTLQFMPIIGLFIIIIPILFILGKYFKWHELNIITKDWEDILPILSLEFVLIYFFRVILSHYNSVQTQILQIELRRSLCQFIQNYAEYAKKIRELENGKESTNILERFEAIIFSNILSTPDKVPSTFDGLEHISNFLKELKK